jgi:hypothetical protein
MEVGGQRQAQVALPQRKRHSTHSTVGWFGPRASVDLIRGASSA